MKITSLSQRIAPMDPSLRGQLQTLCDPSGTESIALEKDACHAVAVARDQAIIFVISGLVMTVRQSKEERRQVLGFHWPGAMIVVQSETESAPLSIAAVETSKLLQVDRDSLDRAVQDNASLARALFDQALESLIVRQRAYHRMLCPSAEARVAAFLFEQEPWIASGKGATPIFDLPMRRSDIADHIGVRAETLCRVLTDWRHRGLIMTKGPRHLTLTDPKALRRIAKQTEPGDIGGGPSSGPSRAAAGAGLSYAQPQRCCQD